MRTIEWIKSNNLTYLNMSYYFDICDKKFSSKSKNKHFESLSHIDNEKCIQINYTFQNPNFFDIAKLYNVFFNNPYKKIEISCVKLDFRLDFGTTIQALITSEIDLNISLFDSLEFLQCSTECVTLKRYKFSHITELSIKTFSNKTKMTYE